MKTKAESRVPAESYQVVKPQIVRELDRALFDDSMKMTDDDDTVDHYAAATGHSGTKLLKLLTEDSSRVSALGSGYGSSIEKKVEGELQGAATAASKRQVSASRASQALSRHETRLTARTVLSGQCRFEGVCGGGSGVHTRAGFNSPERAKVRTGGGRPSLERLCDMSPGVC